MLKDEYDKITHEIIGWVMEVHKILGNWFQEVVYQRSLSVEINLQKIEHKGEFEMRLCYKGVDVGERRVDFLVANEISIEIKAIVNLKNVH
jgi:GxxExxY protein